MGHIGVSHALMFQHAIGRLSKQADRARLVIEVVRRENNDNGKQEAAALEYQRSYPNGRSTSLSAAAQCSSRSRDATTNNIRARVRYCTI